MSYTITDDNDVIQVRASITNHDEFQEFVEKLEALRIKRLTEKTNDRPSEPVRAPEPADHAPDREAEAQEGGFVEEIKGSQQWWPGLKGFPASQTGE